MITKKVAGTNTKEFVDWANNLIQLTGFEKIIYDMILDAYDNDVSPVELKDYLFSQINFNFIHYMVKTEAEFNFMLARRDAGFHSLSDDDVLACAAHEVWKKVTK